MERVNFILVYFNGKHLFVTQVYHNTNSYCEVSRSIYLGHAMRYESLTETMFTEGIEEERKEPSEMFVG